MNEDNLKIENDVVEIMDNKNTRISLNKEDKNFSNKKIYNIIKVRA